MLMVVWGLLTIKDTDQLSLAEIQNMGKVAKRNKEGMDTTNDVDGETRL